MNGDFQLITDKTQVATASLQKEPGRVSKLMHKLKRRIIQRIADIYDILPSRIGVLWVPEKCDALLFERPCCGSLIRSAVSIRHSTSSLLADSLCGEEEDEEDDENDTVGRLMSDSALMLICEESGEESRYQRAMANDCDVAGSILIDEMEDRTDIEGELLYMLCGCYMKTVIGTENTAITVTVYGYTHVTDATLHSAKHKLIVRGNPSRFSANTIEPANRILEVLNNFQKPIYDVLRRIDQASAAIAEYPSDCDEDIDIDPHISQSLGEGEDEEESMSGYDDDDDLVSSQIPKTPAPKAIFRTEDIVKRVEDPSKFRDWIYIPGGYSPEPGEHETTALTVAFQSRAQLILQTIVEMWSDNQTALHYFRKRNITYIRPEYLQVDRVIMAYLALAVCHHRDWSEMFIDGVARLCEKLYDQVNGIDARENILRINNIRIKPVDIRSLEDSHGKIVQSVAREGLVQLVAMWRTLMAVDLDQARATRWPNTMPSIVENFLEATWTFLENEF